jgi:transposase-like protein
MFSNKDDTTDIIKARGVELKTIRAWIEHYRKTRKNMPSESHENDLEAAKLLLRVDDNNEKKSNAGSRGSGGRAQYDRIE